MIGETPKFNVFNFLEQPSTNESLDINNESCVNLSVAEQQEYKYAGKGINPKSHPLESKINFMKICR